MSETLGMPDILLPGGLDPGMSDPSKQPSPSMLDKMKLVAKILQVGGGQAGSMMDRSGGSGSAARTPGVPNPQPINLPQGSMAAAIQPQPQSPMPQAPSIGASVQPSQNTGNNWQFASSKARNAAVVSNAIQGFSQLAQGIHQKKFQEQVAEATQIWQMYLQKTKALEAAKQTGDQEQIQAAGQDLQKFGQDKKVAKVLATVSDPKKAMSPQAIGIQRAMQASQEQARQQAELEKTQATAAAERARAEQEQATAEWRRKQASMVGEVTPEERFKQAAKSGDVKTVVTALAERSKQQATDRLKQITDQLASAERIATHHDNTLKSIAKNKDGDKDLLAITKESEAINDQIKGLNAEAGKVQDAITKALLPAWLSSEKAANMQKIQNIDVQRQMLMRQQDVLKQKWAAMASVGKLPVEPEPPAAGVSQSDSGSQNDNVTDEQLLKMLNQSDDSKGSQYSEN